jgi:hypothetical protein
MRAVKIKTKEIPKPLIHIKNSNKYQKRNKIPVLLLKSQSANVTHEQFIFPKDRPKRKFGREGLLCTPRGHSKN